MRVRAAYVPSVILLAVGIVAVALVPPIPQPTGCVCFPGPGSQGTCACATGYAINFTGTVVLVVCGLAALISAVAVRAVGRRTAPAP